MQNCSLHTHTINFDGQNTIKQMIETAQQRGIKTLGISNHFIVHNNVKNSKMYKYAIMGGYEKIYSSSFEEVLGKFIPHYEELEKEASAAKIRVLRGMEVDFFNTLEWIKNFEKVVKELNPDYVIGSAHFISYKDQLLNMHDLERADANMQNMLLSNYWNNVAEAASSGLFTWMAHLDLPKKVGVGRDLKWQDYEFNTVSKIAEKGIGIEINTGLYTQECYEPYPSDRILQFVADLKVPIIISDDAHKAEQLKRHFEEAEELIHKYKLLRMVNIH